MSTLTVDHLDQLLDQAEQRLGNCSDADMTSPFVTTNTSVEETTKRDTVTPARSNPEKVTLRNPQREEKIIKVSNMTCSAATLDDENEPLAAPLTWASYSS